MPDTDASNPRVRLDKWLWAARFFKTRGLATDAIKGGKVEINGQRAKPARAVTVGDRLAVRKGPVAFEITVDALSERRGPAREAEKLYTESEASRARREEEAAMRRAAGRGQKAPKHAPAKQDRQALIRLKRGGR